jgi:predicted RNase H-like HicB family nuclease
MVLVPSLPGCVTYGRTIEDALAMAKEAITLHIEGMSASGEEIPKDEGKPILATVGVASDLPIAGPPLPQGGTGE